MFKPKVLYNCICCNGPITEKDMQMPCSLCGYGMHYQCGVNNLSRHTPQQIKWFMRSYHLKQVYHYGRYYYTFCPRCQNVLNTQFLGPLAHRLELTARYEELAQLYEDFGYLAQAGQVRNRMNQHVVKNITVDVNSLIQQMNSGSLNIPYKCPNCGAALNVRSDLGENGVRYCQYCGTAINTEIVSNVIKQALK
jgi:DNA-directed RNA polymerase subunit RPC12/RpoP